MAVHNQLVSSGSTHPGGWPDDASQLLRKVLPVHAEGDGRLDPVSFAPDVVSSSLEPQTVKPALSAHESHGVRQLQFPAFARADLLEVREDLRFEYVPANYG